jgi:hypothetical protein
MCDFVNIDSVEHRYNSISAFFFFFFLIWQNFIKNGEILKEKFDNENIFWDLNV